LIIFLGFFAARPYWVNQAPADVMIGVQEDAEFQCMVDGMPKPVVEWFIDTKPIAGTLISHFVFLDVDKSPLRNK
jgi:hypothetical protein